MAARSSSFEIGRLKSNFTNLLSRKSTEVEKDEAPTVYLIIHNAEPRKVGLSWTITIHMLDGLDYLFDVVPKPKYQKGYLVRLDRYPSAVVHSKFYKATIKLGVIPSKSAAGKHAIGHVVEQFRSQSIDSTKPQGLSMVWVTDVLEKLKRTGLLIPEKGVDEKIEKQISLLKEQLKAARKYQPL